ncbi:class II histone deacetylase [Actinomadura atramentaria]|uniref:class II histone deacetylase n=1 Tax=Actinomadura atramentaria TaxID=1990 RepID=UPI00036B542A|nr:class II histone deacetylase [Actinomadura atramentaria]
MGTGWVWNERLAWFDNGRWAGPLAPGGFVEPGEHMENGETKRRVASLVAASGLLDRLTPVAARRATREELLRVHTPGYLDYLAAENAKPKGGFADREIQRVPFGPGDLEIAELAAGGTIEAADAVARGAVRNAYVLTRPPGHHALPDTGLGFCVLANVALAVEHVRAVHGIERVAVVDWDVHHGNGTQDIFYGDPDVLTVSIHQDRLFPDGGLAAETGGPGAEGANVNVPLPAGCGTGAYEYAFEQIVLPRLRAFRPQFVVAASGYDSAAFDPNGRMMLHSDAYRWMTERLMAVAAESADDRLLVVHEGGYSAFYVPFCALAVVEALSGHRTEAADPALARLAANPLQALQPHQAALVTAIRDGGAPTDSGVPA